MEDAESSPTELTDVLAGQVELTASCTVALTRGVRVQSGPALRDCSWYDALRRCNELSVQAGLSSVYTITEPTPRDDLRLHEVLRRVGDFLTEDQKNTLLNWVQTEPGEGKRKTRRLRKVSTGEIARDLVGLLQFQPKDIGRLPGIGSATVERVRREWNPEEFCEVGVLWDREATGYRLPTEAEWRLAMSSRASQGAEWVFDSEAAGIRRGRLAGPPPDGLHTDWFCQTGGPMRIVMEQVGTEFKRSCLQPFERGRGVGFRAVLPL